jgi:2-polyprenyl-6-methoxyphenol hydroxylase-like FAD-dependent oxidoreductase
MAQRYDLAIAGGGLGGAALAKSMAESGAKVLVVEHERQFKDRVRGELMVPWGYAEARALGVAGLLDDAIGHVVPFIDVYVRTERIMHRDVAATTPQQLPCLAFYHPAMQESLLQAASAAGATVRRGAAVREVRPGETPSVVLEERGQIEAIPARLVVGADGRSSVVRSSARFQLQHDPEDIMIAGVLLENVPSNENAGELIYNFGLGQFTGVFPQGGGRVRMYLSYHNGSRPRYQGHADLDRFMQGCRDTGANPAYFDGAKPTGPLATFSAAQTWVEHPYRDGVVLLGDAATSSDPTWGQGLSLTQRDARVLRDHLLATEDWDAAGHAYAAEHDRYAGFLHTFNLWFDEFYMKIGPEADARRARALPLIVEDPSRHPDSTFSGPDVPADESLKERFFAEAV